MPQAASILVTTDDPDVLSENGESDVALTLPDGSVVIDLAPRRPRDNKPSKFDDNLALDMAPSDLRTVAERLLDGIDADIKSRAEWEQMRIRGIEMLGLRMEAPRSDVGAAGAPLEGMSVVRDSTLLEAVLRFQANAIGELLPAGGPVKIKVVGPDNTIADQMAEAFEEGFNYYLTDIATEYYPDTKRLLFWTGFGGSGFKKVYWCPIRRRPVSESVDASDLIVSNAATDLGNAARVTHRITMRPSVMKRMQYLGVYRDVPLGQPTPDLNRVEDKKDQIEGIASGQTRPEDEPYTLYECHCEWDFDEFAPPKFKGKSIPLPYRITIDKDSREILEIHRNWREDDEDCLPRKYFVRYPYIEGLGIYGIGLMHVLGNAAMTLTAAEREMVDAGMFANFPGFLIAKAASRQLTNEMRVPPGGSQVVDTGGGKLSDAVMPIPYKDVTPGLLALYDKIKADAQRLGGTADLPIGEGKQDAPVGTTLALIEQATKIESAVHKGLHQAQSEEFQLLKELFREDPEAFWRHAPKGSRSWTTETFLAALDNADLVPVADPNTPSHMHRIAKALAIKQLQAASPQLYDPKAVDRRVLAMIKVDDAESLFAPPQAPAGPDPKLIEASAKLMTAQTAQQKLAVESAGRAAELADNQAERESRENIETMKLAQAMVVHSNDAAAANRRDVLAATDSAHQRMIDIHNATQPKTPAGGG